MNYSSESGKSLSLRQMIWAASIFSNEDIQEWRGRGRIARRGVRPVSPI